MNYFLSLQRGLSQQIVSYRVTFKAGRVSNLIIQAFENDCQSTWRFAARLDSEPLHQSRYFYDYQSAILPSFPSKQKCLATLFFWHVRWPIFVSNDAAVQLVEIGKALLRCAEVSFQAESCVVKLSSFARDYLPEFIVDLMVLELFTGRVARQLVASND